MIGKMTALTLGAYAFLKAQALAIMDDRRFLNDF